MGTNRTFVINVVDSHGLSSLLNGDITQLKDVGAELLVVLLSYILFVCKDSQVLELVGDTVQAHLNGYTDIPEIFVDFDSTAELCNGTSFANWELCEDAHGDIEGAEEAFEKWMQAISALPRQTKVLLVFSAFWRDYRSLPGVCSEAKLVKPNIFFQFRISATSNILDIAFHMKQTIAAVVDIKSNVRHGFDPKRRLYLVNHGCRGFEERTNPSSLGEI